MCVFYRVRARVYCDLQSNQRSFTNPLCARGGGYIITITIIMNAIAQTRLGPRPAEKVVVAAAER
jgi:hypothetical protein